MSARRLTPAGSGGVAVLEVSGELGLERLRDWCGSLPAVGELRRVHPVHHGEVLDEALLVARAPGVFELHVHGSPPLVQELLTLLGAAGVRERSPRLLRALAQASCDAAARILLDQVEGAWSRELERLAALPLAERRRDLELLAQRGEQVAGLFEPRRIVLVGPTNAGKSTLFNALLARRRAIVSEEEGTTRDAVVADAQLGAWPFVLVDTAGEREVVDSPQGRVEAAGQAVAQDWVRAADLVLRLTPAGSVAVPRPAPGTLDLWTQVDQAPEAPAPGGFRSIAAGSSEQGGAAGARATVTDWVHEHLGLLRDPWVAGQPVPVGARAVALCRSWSRCEDLRRIGRWVRLLGR